MTLLAEKMNVAGVDTVGARLRGELTEGLRRNPHSALDAWRYVATTEWGQAFARQLMEDMGLSPRNSLANANPATGNIKPYQPLETRKNRLERLAPKLEIVRSKYKNSGGIAWSDVSCHEAMALTRDGAEAAALLAECPPNLLNDGRTFGDVLGIKRVDEIIANVRI